MGDERNGIIQVTNGIFPGQFHKGAKRNIVRTVIPDFCVWIRERQRMLNRLKLKSDTSKGPKGVGLIVRFCNFVNVS